MTPVLRHFAINATDLDAARRFYGATFGWGFSPWGPPGFFHVVNGDDRVQGALQQRRSLVLLITNVRDEDIDELLQAVRQLQKRHLVCVASLREQVLERPPEQPVADLADAIGVGALAQYIEQRSRAHEALRSQGTDVLDVTCAELPAALVQHYLAVKRAARL